jgi:hypothetical protein
METMGRKSRLRLVRLAGDSVLKEKILPREELNKDLVDIIAEQMTSIIEEMEAEWENNPDSGELREGFSLMTHYLECLVKYGSRKARA